jgi:hypothetical protein
MLAVGTGCVVIAVAVLIVTVALPVPVPAPFASLTLAIVYTAGVTFGVTLIVLVPDVNVPVVPSLNVTLILPDPVNTNVKFAVPFAQILGVPLNTAVANALTVIVAVPPLLKPVVLTPLFASVTLTNVTLYVPAGNIVPKLNAVPLAIFVAVYVLPSTRYTTWYGAGAATLDVYVIVGVTPACTVLPDKLPCGTAVSVTTVTVDVTVPHPPVTATL